MNHCSQQMPMSQISRYYLLGPYREAILDKVKAQPDITMPDLAAKADLRGFAHALSA